MADTETTTPVYRVVNILRNDGRWAAEVDVNSDGVKGQTVRVTARSLLELVGLVHEHVLLAENRPAAITFVYPWGEQRHHVQRLGAAAVAATLNFENARDKLLTELAASGVTKADQDRLMAAPVSTVKRGE